MSQWKEDDVNMVEAIQRIQEAMEDHYEGNEETTVKKVINKVMGELELSHTPICEIRKSIGVERGPNGVKKYDVWEVSFDGNMDSETQDVVAELVAEKLNLTTKSIKWVGICS